MTICSSVPPIARVSFYGLCEKVIMDRPLEQCTHAGKRVGKVSRGGQSRSVDFIFQHQEARLARQGANMFSILPVRADTLGRTQHPPLFTRPRLRRSKLNVFFRSPVLRPAAPALAPLQSAINHCKNRRIPASTLSNLLVHCSRRAAGDREDKDIAISPRHHLLNIP